MKNNVEYAKEVAEKLKKKYKHGKSTCPAWFGNAIPFMEQDGGYSVAVCIPSWSSIPEEEANVFLERFEGLRITLRVVTPPSYKIKKEKAKEDEKDKRSSDR